MRFIENSFLIFRALNMPSNDKKSITCMSKHNACNIIILFWQLINVAKKIRMHVRDAQKSIVRNVLVRTYYFGYCQASSCTKKVGSLLAVSMYTNKVFFRDWRACQACVEELFEGLILFFQAREASHERSSRRVENYWVSDRQGFACFQFSLLCSNCVIFPLNGLWGGFHGRLPL